MRNLFRACARLEKSKNLIFKPLNKDGNGGPWSHSICKDGPEHLGGQRILWYPTNAFASDLEPILITALDQRIISKKKCEFMMLKDPKIATFYALSKIHKRWNPLKGRPIVSGIKTVTQNIGIYLDKVLRDFVLTLPSYICDTSHLLKKLEGIRANIWP